MPAAFRNRRYLLHPWKRSIDISLMTFDIAENKEIIINLGGVQALQRLARSLNERICQQATRALVNLGAEVQDH